MELTATQNDLSILHLITNASLLVQLVMALLLVASIISWTMIFRKWLSLRAAKREADEFEQEFWQGGEMDKLYNRYTSGHVQPIGMAAMFVNGLTEFKRLAEKDVAKPDIVNGVQRAMRVSLAREIDDLETHLSFLATVGSTSPYVGLFGTVWGIMNSFRSLGSIKHVTIGTVAPGIAEALVATAMGLFAAIPAVVAYNRFSHDVERLAFRYENFMEELLSIINRQLYGSRRRRAEDAS